jgi:hypothetical protein
MSQLPAIYHIGGDEPDQIYVSMQGRKGFWRTALSWFTGEYIFDAVKNWRTADLVGKAKV